MTELDALLPLWVQSPDADLRGVVADILTELAAAVADHLDVVEADGAAGRRSSLHAW